MAVKEAQRLFGGSARLRFECRSAFGGGAPGSKADVLVMRLVLMHLPNRVETLGGLRAWVKPAGQLHLIEGDDRQIRLDPPLPGMQELLALMQRVQEARGGSRHLGSELEPLLARAGWRPQGSQRSCPEPAMAAAALPAVFLPVADFYLKDAEQRGWLAPGEADSWGRRLRQACANGLENAELPLYHTWAAL